MTHTAARIRQEFIDYFEQKHGHTFAPSGPVVPVDDPTLLFTNAGMNQFKDVFLATGTRPFNRAVNSQKCIRAGGKHNDLEDVGRDTFHHTFFEMLGNWSFGDYFKAEAIEWAWDLLTNVWGLEKDRLYATVFAGDTKDGLEADTDAEQLWTSVTDINPAQVSRWGKKDNFWEMGATGPCGPCSEIHYDCRPSAERAAKPGAELVNADHPDVLEIWNLVFIQYNRGEGGVLTPLPAQHVDTGMGFERVVRILQHKTSNYDTDLWFPIFMAIEAHTGAHPYQGHLHDPIDIAYRVIADHARCLTIALADGARPGNEGRGYVLRRILRRALRVAHQTLKIEGPVLCHIVPAVVESLGGAFPDLTRSPDELVGIIAAEEKAFLKTIDRGLAMFTDAAQRAKLKGSTEIPADEAFRLHDTFGFPIDLTQVMADERGMNVDLDGFESLMDKARATSRAVAPAASAVDVAQFNLPPDALASLKKNNVEPTLDLDKYHARPLGAKLQAIWNGEDFDNTAYVGRRVAIITNRTNFYAEQGGQVGDHGMILTDHDAGNIPMRGYSGRRSGGGCSFRVDDTQVIGGYVLHIGESIDDELRVRDRLQMQIDKHRREPVMANHTVTHLMNHALRAVLGDDVQQKGSLVAADRLRFDFSHHGAMTPEELEQVEQRVNAIIGHDQQVYAVDVPLELAKNINGVRAVFGEHYPDPVRVVCIGQTVGQLVRQLDNPAWLEHSIEFCGGTHLQHTAQAEQFIIVQETALAAGVRRMTAVTGEAAQEADRHAQSLESRIIRASELNDEAMPIECDRIGRHIEEDALSLTARKRLSGLHAELRDRARTILKQTDAADREKVVNLARRLAEDDDGPVIVHRVPGADKDTLLVAMDVFRAKRPEAATMLFAASEVEAKVSIVAGVPKDLIAKGLKAGDWVKQAAQVCGGGGGGRPDMAQAGGKNPEKVDEAITKAREFAQSLLE